MFKLFNSAHSLLHIDIYIKLSIIRSETPVYVIYVVANRYLKTIIQNDLAVRKKSHLLFLKEIIIGFVLYFALTDEDLNCQVGINLIKRKTC